QRAVFRDSREYRDARAMPAARFEQGLDGISRGQREYAVASGMARDDIERACADRTGRTQKRDVARLHAQLVPAHEPSSAPTGSAAHTLSMRSSTPPCPGSSLPLSLTPAWRLASDSNRSPRIPQTQSTIAAPAYGAQAIPVTCAPIAGIEAARITA